MKLLYTLSKSWCTLYIWFLLVALLPHRSDNNWTQNRNHYRQLMAMYEPLAQKDIKIKNNLEINFNKMVMKILYV